MDILADYDLDAPQTDSQARRMLLRRLVDVVARPASAVGVQDRAIAGDLLLEMLIDADEESRQICAARLAEMVEAPRRVLRFLAQDVASVSDIVLANGAGLDQSDLVNVAVAGAAHHRIVIAGRRDVGPCVSDAIVQSGDIAAMARMLSNPTTQLSDFAVDRLVTESRDAPQLTELLMRRPELRPAHALVMFWWCGRATRTEILRRFSAERQVIIDNCSDIFSVAADEKWTDPVLRKALQVIERRQRNRGALERSAFSSLEDAIAQALKTGLTRETIDEISFLCGIKPLTGAKIFADKGGEGIAVLCKSVGLKRQYFKALWMALKRPASRPGATVQDFEEVLEVFEMMAVAKAQTVLRYWNWSLSAAFSPEILKSEPGDSGADSASEGPTSRSIRLIFGR